MDLTFGNTLQHRRRLNNWRMIKRQHEQATENKVALIFGECDELLHAVYRHWIACIVFNLGGKELGNENSMGESA